MFFTFIDLFYSLNLTNPLSFLFSLICLICIFFIDICTCVHLLFDFFFMNWLVNAEEVEELSLIHI